MKPAVSITPITDALWERRLWSPFHRVDRRRPMAFLCSHRQWHYLKMEHMRPSDPMDADVITQVFRSVPPRLFGHNVYVGTVNPDALPLFLPEPTVRSMVGLWGSS